jgi:hypothetical protein
MRILRLALILLALGAADRHGSESARIVRQLKKSKVSQLDLTDGCKPSCANGTVCFWAGWGEKACFYPCMSDSDCSRGTRCLCGAIDGAPPLPCYMGGMHDHPYWVCTKKGEWPQ